jgi:hypothetical protein
MKLHKKLHITKDARHVAVAQPSSTACVFFAQHLPEIAQMGL